jgi:hypothetical protein
MNKKTIIIIAGLLVLASAAAFIVASFQGQKSAPTGKNNPSSELILFYSKTCPHCLKVEEFMTQNKIEEKIKIDKKEVSENRDNSFLLGEKAKKCGLNASSLGVPFLWNGSTGQCLIGDADIIKFFQNKISQ